MIRLLKLVVVRVPCLSLLPIDGMAAWAEEKSVEPPRYMRELSQLAAATASEDDFGEIRLTLGVSEMEVDGEKQKISENDDIASFVDEDGVLQIPEEAVAGAEAPDESGLLTEEELKAQGYEVQIDHESGTVSITEPYGLCCLIVKTEDRKVQDTYGATQTLSISDNRTVLQYTTKADTEKAATLLEQDVSFNRTAVDGLHSMLFAPVGRFVPKTRPFIPELLKCLFSYAMMEMEKAERSEST